MEIKDGFFDTGEIRLHYIEGPDAGPPLVMLHGATGNCQAWNNLLPELTRRWHVYALDLRGHGQSGRGDGPAGYHVTRNVSDVLAFLRGLVKEPAVLFGHSWGGVIALMCGGPGKAHLRGLVLEDPPTILRRPNTVLKPYLEYFGWLYQAKQTARTVEEMSAALLQANPHGVPPETLDPWARQLLAVDDHFLLATQSGSMMVDGVDFEGAVREVACPIVLLQADPALGAALVEEEIDTILQNARDARLVRFPGASHMIHDEQPEKFLQAFDHF